MSISFSNSIQSLRADRTRPTLIGLGIGLFLLLLWAIWFFFAPITLYATGTISGVTRDGTLLTIFPASVATELAQGQSARIIFTDPTTLNRADPNGERSDMAVITQPIPGFVARIMGYNDDGSIEVALVLETPLPAALEDPSTAAGQAEVEVAVAHVSPAVLFARASGLSPDGNGTRIVSYSPTD